MAISTRTTDYPEPGTGVGSSGGSGSDFGDALETELSTTAQSEAQHAEVPAVDALTLAPVEPEVVIPEAPVQVVATQLGDVAVDAARLVELQIRLFEAECRQSGNELVQPLAILSATLILGVASAVVLLLAMGTGLHELTNWPLSLSLLLAAAVGITGAVVAVKYALVLLKTPRISFEKSKAELMRNVEFLSRVLKSR